MNWSLPYVDFFRKEKEMTIGRKQHFKKKLFLRKHVIFCTSLGNLFEVADVELHDIKGIS